jgi:hypothetical protein
MRNDELEVRPSTETPASEQELGRKQDETSEGPNRVFSSQVFAFVIPNRRLDLACLARGHLAEGRMGVKTGNNGNMREFSEINTPYIEKSRDILQFSREYIFRSRCFAKVICNLIFPPTRLQIRDQLWRHAGMVRKPLPAGAMQTAVKPPLPWPKGGLGTAASLPKGPGPSRLASATFSGLQYSRSSVSSAGRISGLLAPDKRNPKSLKVCNLCAHDVCWSFRVNESDSNNGDNLKLLTSF